MATNIAPPIFALGPALVTNAVIDYSQAAGIKLYRSATAKLQEDLYDCDPAGLRDIMDSLLERAGEYGWTSGIFTIPVDIANPLGTGINIITNHGQVTWEHVREYGATYNTLPTRASQDAVQSYRCLYNSLSSTGRNKITVWRDQYVINDIPNGPAFWKVIVRESHLDTNATTAGLRTKLASLDTYLPKIGYDIEKFNTYVLHLVEALAARGEATTDLLTNLFKGYKSALDKKFVAYIEKKEDDYFDGYNMDAKKLMHLAVNKFKILKDQDLWNAPSPEEEKIIALEAKIHALQKKPGKTPGTKAIVPGDDTIRPKSRKDKPDWMFKEPTDKSKPKVVNDKEYWWCPKHKCMTRHKPSECRKPTESKGTSTDTAKKTTKELTLTQALAAVQEKGDDCSDPDDSADEE